MNGYNQKKIRRNLMFAILVLFLLIMGIALYFIYFPLQIGAAQPIHFSHRVHTSDKGLSCFFCHDGAIETARAGIPPLQTCMLCHRRIIIHHPEIEKLRAAYNQNKPILWIQVQNVPDFVYFNHSMHLHRQIDCSRCHGNVKGMDRIDAVNNFNMGFCIRCHLANKASRDCFVCHR